MPWTRSPSSSWWTSDLLAAGEQVTQLGEDLGEEPVVRLVRRERAVQPGDAELVVVVEVVRRRDERDDPGEALLADPDDLLLAADATVVGAVAARPLAHGQLVGDHPGEVPRLDPLGPLALHRGHRSSSMEATSAAARTVGPTSCARIILAPCHIAQVAVASEPSRRSSTGTGGRSALCPRRPQRRRRRGGGRGSPCGSSRRRPGSRCSTSLSRLATRARLCSSVFPKPMPGSTHTSSTPAADRRLRPVAKEARDLAHDVVVARGRPASSRIALHVHGHEADARPGGRGDLGERGRHVVEQRGPGGQRRLGHLGVSGVDAHPHPAGEGLDDRDDAAHLLGRGRPASAPGRVDSPPTSTTAAPAAAMARPCSTAAAWSSHRPPSEKESGVTLRTPITSGAGRSGTTGPG